MECICALCVHLKRSQSRHLPEMEQIMDAMKLRGTGNDTTASLEQASPALRTTEGRNAAQAQKNNLSEIRTETRQNENTQNAGLDAAKKRIDNDTVRANAEAAAETKEALMDRSIVSRDKDGDTLAVSKAGENDLDESRQGSVIEKDDEKTNARDDAKTALSDEAARRAEQSREARIEFIAEQRIAREAAREKAAEQAQAERQAQAAESNETKAPEVTSFAGVTNNQLEEYYLEGRISRNDYENEVNSREERLKAKEEKAAENSADLAKLDEVKRNVQEGEEAVANINGEIGADGMRGSERLDAARNASQNDNDNAFENASVNVSTGAGAVADTVSLRTDDGAVRAAQNENKQNTDSLLRGEERIQWDYR